mmetsp:Transcript_1272/g.2681  ORF Transcript_1272/g.2681 Transcript_1272/m.2681 type:complete len:206 (-) Transcript_1272:554-1171(-)
MATTCSSGCGSVLTHAVVPSAAICVWKVSTGWTAETRICFVSWSIARPSVSEAKSFLKTSAGTASASGVARTTSELSGELDELEGDSKAASQAEGALPLSGSLRMAASRQKAAYTSSPRKRARAMRRCRPRSARATRPKCSANQETVASSAFSVSASPSIADVAAESASAATMRSSERRMSKRRAASRSLSGASLSEASSSLASV